jgi:hypothetical protein
MPWLGFEPTIRALKRTKTVHALDCAATVISYVINTPDHVISVAVKLQISVRYYNQCFIENTETVFLCFVKLNLMMSLTSENFDFTIV